MRSNYLVVLEITPLTPLTHGAGSRGNEQVLRTTEYLVGDQDELGKTTARRIQVPVVSGSAMRATLREHAFGHLAEVLGVEDGSVDRDKLRLLLKGGKNDSGGASVSLEEARRLRRLFPMLAVFGSMDGGLPIRGELSVSPVRPFVRELVDAGYLPRQIGALDVVVGATEATARPLITVHAGLDPVPLSAIRTREEYFRHDLRTSPHVRYLEGATAAAIEDKAAARKGKAVKSEVRREANESMPHSFQAIAPGTPMVCELRLQGATEVEFECLAYAILRWVSLGAHLGGGGGRGHGQCQVRAAGALKYSPPSGVAAAQPGTEVSIDRAGSAYIAHLQQFAVEIRADLAGKAVT